MIIQTWVVKYELGLIDLNEFDLNIILFFFFLGEVQLAVFHSVHKKTLVVNGIQTIFIYDLEMEESVYCI